MNDDYFDVLIARIWAAFGEGAGMPFDGACVQVAKNKGYYDTIRGNASAFLERPDEFEDALRCCRRTGHLAAERAIQAERKEISDADFASAAEEVEQRVARVRERAATNGVGAVRAGVCAALTL